MGCSRPSSFLYILYFSFYIFDEQKNLLYRLSKRKFRIPSARLLEVVFIFQLLKQASKLNVADICYSFSSHTSNVNGSSVEVFTKLTFLSFFSVFVSVLYFNNKAFDFSLTYLYCFFGL